jgi:4-amino-4-deoxy-L-arabinose transferase-like glycosyltransferase
MTSVIALLKAKPIIAVLIIVGILYLAMANNMTPRSDEGSYVLLARSLAAGHGYLEHPLTEERHTKFPYFYPFLISPLQHFFPDSFYLVDLCNAIVTVVAVFLIFIFLKTFFNDKLAALFALLIALNPYTLVQYAHRAAAEPLYLTCTLAAIIFLENYVSSKSSKYLMLSILAITASCYTRQVGVVLMIAAVLYLLCRRDVKGAIIVGVVTTLLIMPWWYRMFIGVVATKEVSPYSVNIPNLSRLQRFGIAFLTYCFSWAHWVVFPTFFSFFRFIRGEVMAGLAPLAVIKHGVTVAIFVPTLVGLLSHIAKKRYFFDFYVLLYGGAICVAGNFWAYRLLYGIVPFLFYYLIIGVQTLLRGARRAQVVAGVLIAIVMGSALVQNAHQVYWERTGRFTRPWNAFFDAAQWIKANTPEDTVIMASKDNNFYIASDRITVDFPCILYTDKPVVEELVSRIREKNVDYVIVTVPPFSWSDLYLKKHDMMHIIETEAERFRLVKVIERYGAEARIYRVRSKRFE